MLIANSEYNKTTMELSITSSGPAHSASARAYTVEEWEQKRPIITQLYRDEEKSLDHVRSVLAQQSFRPTAAMFKKRIKKWNLDRNHKQADMLYAVKIALNREAQGKKTAFVIRGRVVTFEEVQYYFRRKGIRDLRALVKDEDDVNPTTRIECHTPKPASIIADGEDHEVAEIEMATGSSENHLGHFPSQIMAIPDPNQVARVLQQSPRIEPARPIITIWARLLQQLIR
ncbi:hypothetical protein N431DRAFT_476070 [Stipitochalara longipes BDJ]|nr:hypothetical protein N431DRAFT_476070 [Stipitochalara longipes BDJ]